MAEVSTATEIPTEIREFVRYDLAWLANWLHKKYGLTFPEIRQLIRELLDVSI